MHKVIWTDEKKELAIAELTKYFEKHGIGECIQQSDNALIAAPDVLSYIADRILKEGEGIKFADHLTCNDCGWSGCSDECEKEIEPDEFKGTDRVYPVCPNCGGADLI